MAKFDIPRKEFETYPQGLSEGIIYDIEDIGLQETPFGPKHKIIIKTESMKHRVKEGEMAGQPLTIWTRYNLSGHKNSQLRPHREAILGRQLTEDEAHKFDSDELIGVRVFYVIIHQQGNDGRMYAKIDSIGRLEDQTKGTMTMMPAAQEPAAQGLPGEPAANTPQVPAGQPMGGGSSGDDLPFGPVQSIV